MKWILSDQGILLYSNKVSTLFQLFEAILEYWTLSSACQLTSGSLNKMIIYIYQAWRNDAKKKFRVPRKQPKQRKQEYSFVHSSPSRSKQHQKAIPHTYPWFRFALCPQYWDIYRQDRRIFYQMKQAPCVQTVYLSNTRRQCNEKASTDHPRLSRQGPSYRKAHV